MQKYIDEHFNTAASNAPRPPPKQYKRPFAPKQSMQDRGYITPEEARSLYQRQQAGQPGSELPAPLKDSIGNKMMQKMGWREGQGLGRDSSGTATAIVPETYTKGVGLGAGVAMTSEELAGSYQQKARQQARSRFANEQRK